MKEIWKDIKGYEGLYKVSNLGRVKSLNYNRTGNEKDLKININEHGYKYVTLCKNSKLKVMTIHRLIANAFIPNPNKYPCVNHKDEVKTNNSIDNLEWCTYKYNNNYGTKKERISKSNTGKKKSKEAVLKMIEKRSVKVYQYDREINLVKIWKSARECGRNGYNTGHVASCCRGEEKTHKGYIWSTKEIKKDGDNYR